MLADILNQEGPTVGRTLHSLPRGMAFEVAIAGGRSEARHHIGGQRWPGGLRSSIPTPSWWNDWTGDIQETKQVQPIPVEVVSQRSGRDDVVRIRAGKIRLKRERLCSRKRKRLKGKRER